MYFKFITKLAQRVILSSLLLFLPGCNDDHDKPFATEANCELDENLYGVWKVNLGDTLLTYMQIEKGEGSTYQIILKNWTVATEKAEKPIELVAFPYKIDPVTLLVTRDKDMSIEDRKWTYYSYALDKNTRSLRIQTFSVIKNGDLSAVTAAAKCVDSAKLSNSTPFADKMDSSSIPDKPSREDFLSIRLKQAEKKLKLLEEEKAALNSTPDSTTKCPQPEKATVADESKELNKLGDTYYDGKGVAIDYPKAAQYFSKSAELGNSEGQYNLGWCYYNGHGVEKDYRKAASLYAQASDQGFPKAHGQLGICFERGHGVNKNYTQAAVYYQKGADQGVANAQNNLGNLYQFGKGVDKNIQKAVELYKLAVAQGEAAAQNNLANFYSNGIGVKKNAQEAFRLWELAAAQADSAALCNVGWCYEEGTGVQKNVRTAIQYYKKAAELGDTQAKINLDLLLNPPPVQRRLLPCAQCGGKKEVPQTPINMMICPRCNGSGVDPRS